MSIAEIIIIALISTLGATLILVVSLLFIRKQMLESSKGKVMFEINREKRVFRYMSHQSFENNFIPFTSKIAGVYSGRWMPMDRFTRLFTNETLKNYRQAKHNLETKVEVEARFKAELKRTPLSKKNVNFDMHIILNRPSDNFLHATVVYKNILQKSKPKSIVKFNDEFFFKHKNGNVILLMFNTRHKSETKRKQLVQIVKRNIHHSFKVTFYKGRLIFVFPNPHSYRLFSKIEKSLDSIVREMKNTATSSLCKSAGYITVPMPMNPKKMTDAIIQLEFLLGKSNRTSKIESFIPEDMHKYKLFKKGFLDLERSIKTSDLKFARSSVKEFKTNKTIAHFGYPIIEGMNNSLFEELKTITYLKKDLTNVHIDSLIKEKTKEPIIIDVTPEWFVSHFNKLINKNIIYTIDIRIHETSHELLAAMAQLQEKGFICGLRLFSLNLREMNFIEKSRPQFIIISKYISNKMHNPKIYLKLINLNETFQKRGIGIIFESPSLKIDNKQVEKIGLHAYYKFE